MTPVQAARYAAREAWPNERDENQDAWSPRLISEPDMAAETVREARVRIAQRLIWLEEAARVLGVDSGSERG